MKKKKLIPLIFTKYQFLFFIGELIQEIKCSLSGAFLIINTYCIDDIIYHNSMYP